MLDFLSFFALAGNFYLLFFLTFSLYPKEINITKIFSWVLSRWASLGFGKRFLDITVCKRINLVEAVKGALKEHGDDDFIVENGCNFIEKFLTKDDKDAVDNSILIFELLEKRRNDRNLTIIAICNLIIGITVCNQLTTHFLIESDNFLPVLMEIAVNCYQDRNLDVLRQLILCLESISTKSDDGKVKLINLDILTFLLGVLEFSTDSATVKGCLYIIAGLLLNHSTNVFTQVPQIDLKTAITKVRVKFIRANEVVSVAIEVLERLKPEFPSESFSVGPSLSPSDSFMSSSSRSRMDGEATLTYLQPDSVDRVSENVSQQLGTWLQEKQLPEPVDSTEKLTAELAEKDRDLAELTESLRQSHLMRSTLEDQKEQLSLLLEAKRKELQDLQVQTSKGADNTRFLEKQLYDARAEVVRLQATAKDLGTANSRALDTLRSEKDAQILQITEQQQRVAQEKMDQLNLKLTSRERELNHLLMEACNRADHFKESAKELEKNNLTIQDSLKKETEAFKIRIKGLVEENKRLNSDLQKQKSVNTHVEVWEKEKQALLSGFEEERRRHSADVQVLQRPVQAKESELVSRLQTQQDELNAVKAEEKRALEANWAEEKRQLLSEILLTVGGEPFTMRRSVCPLFATSIENRFSPSVDGRYRIQRDATQFQRMLNYLETKVTPTDLHLLSLLRAELLFYEIALPVELVETWDANFSSHNFPSITNTFSIGAADHDRYTVCANKGLTVYSLRILGIEASSIMRVGFRFPCTEEFCGAILLELPQPMKSNPNPNDDPIELQLQVSYDPDHQSIQLSSGNGNFDFRDIFNRGDWVYQYRFCESTVTDFVRGQCSQRRVYRWGLRPCADSEELMRRQLTQVKPAMYPLVDCGGSAMTVSILNGSSRNMIENTIFGFGQWCPERRANAL